MASTDDLSLLAPNLARGVLASADETFRLREYLRARAPSPRLPEAPQPGRAFLELNGKLRSGRQPQQFQFGLKWKALVLGGGEPHKSALAAGSDYDVDQIKDELLAGVLCRSDEQLCARLRSGRLPANREIGILLRPVVLPPPPQPPPDPASPSRGAEEEEEEAGQLAQEQEPRTVARPADLEQQEQQQGCKTPGTALDRTPMEGVPERLSPTMAGRRLAATPGTVLGRTPIEGVPERLTSGRQTLAAMRRAVTPLTALGRTPVEGVPERAAPRGRLLLPSSLRPRCSQEQAQQSVGSPTWGVVQQQAARSGPGAGPVPAPDDFTFNTSPLSQQGARGQGEASGSAGEEDAAGQAAGSSEGGAAAVEPPASGADPWGASDGDLDGGGFDYGGNDEPSVFKPAADGATPLPFWAVDAAVQTGVSLRSHATPNSGPQWEEAVADMAAQTGASLQQQPGAEDAAELGGAGCDGNFDYDNDDYDAGGLDHDDSEGEEEAAAVEDMQPPAVEEGLAEEGLDVPEASAQGPRRPERRRTTNHGARLRNELGKRKSLGATPRAGRREVAPGVRRSTRQHTQPLQWWLGEEKIYNREEYKTMPTVSEVVHKTPNTPWRMVQDIYRRPKARQWRQQQEEERPGEQQDMEVDE